MFNCGCEGEMVDISTSIGTVDTTSGVQNAPRSGVLISVEFNTLVQQELLVIIVGVEEPYTVVDKLVNSYKLRISPTKKLFGMLLSVYAVGMWC